MEDAFAGFISIFMFFFVDFIIILSIIVVVIGKRNNKRKSKPQTYRSTAYDDYYNKPYNSENNVIEKILMQNPIFSTDNFKHYAEMVYIKYLTSISKRNTSEVNKFLNTNFSQSHKDYIESITMARRNINIENISIRNIKFTDYKIENNIEYLEISISSTMNKYETNDEGQVLNGYRSRVVSPTEILTFCRNNEDLFKSQSYKCPNCMGAIKNIGDRCEYCGTLIKFNDRNNEGWLLADTKTL